MSLYEFEHAKSAELGIKYICGVDEAGRGPLAGPVFAAAVILPEDFEIEGLNDSKKLSEKKRDLLFDEIIEHALAYSIQSIDHKTIDEINILEATMLAMKTAVENLSIKPERVFIDGNRVPKNMEVPAEFVIKGDATSASIAAASILAKVSRDRLMLEMDKKYPEYCFAKHKGYGTKLHYEKIREFGPSEIHRLTFLKKMH
ncbi:MAG: ribonuclease HII [Oscillospiraceae bacterium]|nr:ribonuclease HII [Oscillospiraceae bacterium]MBP1575862.1 ribonuclease HII [Oscillospiraceae bacterium]